MNSYNEIIAINGVPGSGKSTFASNIVEMASKRYTTVYFSPTHEQLKNFGRKLAKKGLKFYIMSDESKLDEDLTRFHYSNQKNFTDNKKNIIRQQLWPWLSEIIFDNVNAVLIYFTTTLHATIKQIVSVVSDFKVSSRGVLPYTQL